MLDPSRGWGHTARNQAKNPCSGFSGLRPLKKRRVVFDSGHFAPFDLMIKESLDWFDQYMGPAH